MSDLDQIEELLDEAPQAAASVDDQVNEIEALLNPEGDAPAEVAGDSETELETEEEAEPEVDDEESSGVDYSAVVPMSDGSKVTLGELKDHFQDQQSKTLELQERENALMSQMNEMQEMSQYTQLPPEQLAVIKGRQEQYLQQQHGLMLEAIPAFKDPTAFTEAKKGIDQLAIDYGIQEAVAGISDHKIVKLLHDFASLRSGIKAAKDNVKPLRSKEPRAKTKSPGKLNKVDALAKQARQSGSKSDQIAAIDALLN
jgi:hypothetical protein